MEDITMIDYSCTPRREVFKPHITVRQMGAYVEAHGWKEANKVINNTFPIAAGIYVRVLIHEFLLAKPRLEYLREELRAERISYDELLELQSMVDFIDPDDTELLEAAGVPES